MSPNRQNRAEAIFAAALDLPPAEREGYIAEASGDDAALFAEVRALLAAHEDAPTDFLSSPAAEDNTGGDLDLDATIDAGGSGKTSGKPAGPVSASQPAAVASPSEKAGDMIGRYKLLQEIGEGGFGTVWMAEQTEPVTRRVALKIIKLGMDTKEVIARFEAERQALAMMDDENIAKVFDAGATDRGRPFFVMELVKGMPITQYCDEAGLDTRERLALFADVCSALQHAHQKGIIHRDIKPNNVMVTLHGDRPVVKVIDFGIAKATQGKLTDKTLFTQFEQVIGTPVYMSPEQAGMSGLDIDTRSDIYALGVLLYELLTGRPPFDAKTLVSAGYEEMLRIIREDEPPKPSARLSTVAGMERTTLAKTRKIDPEKLGRLVASDLDWIVMKAIDKDRTRRYETANAFARDIGAYLADEPVSATPPSAGYQLRKFARRNKAAIGVAAVITFLLLGGIAATSWQAIEANRARAQSDRDKDDAVAAQGKEREARVAEAAQREIAEANAEEATKKEEEAKLVLEFFETKVLAATRPKGQPGGLGHDATIKEAMDAAEPQIVMAFSDRPLVEASIRDTLGETYRYLGEPQAAVAQHGRALALHREVLGAEHPLSLDSMNGLGNAYNKAGRHEEALALREETLALCKRVFGAEAHRTLISMINLASSYDVADRHEESISLGEELRELQERVLGAGHPDMLLSMNNLARSYEHAGRHDEALSLNEETLELMKRVLGAEHPNTLDSMTNLAISYDSAGRYEEALTLHDETLGLRRKVLGIEHPRTLNSMYALALSYGRVGRPDQALTLHDETLGLRRKVLGAEHPETVTSMIDLANSYNTVGRHKEALTLNQKAMELGRKVLGAEHPETVRSMNILAVSYSAVGRHEEAVALRKESLRLTKKVLGIEHQNTLTAMNDLAVSYGAIGRHEERVSLREELLELRKKVLGNEHPRTLASMVYLANSYEATGRHDEAITLRENTLGLRRKVLGNEHADTLLAMQDLAVRYTATGRKDEANKLEEELQALRRKVPGSDHPNTPKAKGNGRNMGAARSETVQSPLGFSLFDIAAKDEAGRIPLLGEPDLAIPGESRDGETGVDYDEEHSYTVNDYTLDLLFLAGQLKQINLTTGFDGKLGGIEAIRPFLGDAVKLSAPESATAPELHPALFPNAGDGRVYVEFDEDGMTDTFKLVLPEGDAKQEGEIPTNANKSK